MKSNRGFSLIEIIVATGVLAILAASVAYTVSNASSNFNGAKDEALKARYAAEGYEAVQAIANTSWRNIIGAYSSSQDVFMISGVWTLVWQQGVTTRNNLTRTVGIDAVQRDANGAIVDSGGQPDNNTRKVTVTVSGGGTSSYQLVGYVTNKDAYKFRQTSWNGTTGVWSWSGNDLSNNFYSDDHMTGTSTSGALTMESGSTIGYATSSFMAVSFNTSSAIKNRNVLTLEWTQNVPTDCVLKLYLQASNTEASGVPPAFVTSTVTTVGPFTATTSGTATTSVNIISSYSSISSKKWLRYGVSMRSCSGSFPTLYGLSIYAD